MSQKPLVSVVTPFYNTAPYLRECIESVLTQTHDRFEYVLVDNQSTDGSAEIAKEYALSDRRIRLIRNTEFVGQVRNFNGALSHVSPSARYVKMVLADDYIFPECLARMVAVAEAHPTAAIISSYYLKGAGVCGSGIEYPSDCIPGRVASRLHLLDGHFLFGTPTTLMYRADIVAKRQPFFSESSPHEDTELCHEVMADADLAFVHQVLSFIRVGNEGILTSIDTFNWEMLDFYISLKKFGPVFLSEEEFADRMQAARTEYLTMLGESRVLGREPEFWAYHEKGLAAIGEDLPSLLDLTPKVTRAVLKAFIRPRWYLREKTRLHGRRSRARQNAISHSGADK